MSKNVT